MDYENFIFDLMDTEPAVLAGAIIDNGGKVLFETENWDLSQDLEQLNSVIKESKKDQGKNPGKIEIMKLSYMCVEFNPERVIATNVSKKGHIIIANSDNGAIVAFIDPKKGPRDALFNIQSFAHKL